MLNIKHISTSHLVALAQRSEALNTLLKFTDITSDEFWQAKKDLRKVLEHVQGTDITARDENGDANGNRA